MNFHWADLHVALLDNYCTRFYSSLRFPQIDQTVVLLLKLDQRPNAPLKQTVVSRVSGSLTYHFILELEAPSV